MEKVLLVIAGRRTAKKREITELTSEMERLITSSRGKTVATLQALVEKPSPATYLREGKILELEKLIWQSKPKLLIFSLDLTPTQMRNLEKRFRLRIVDRTGLILDIFACHAKTKEGKLQIELAQLLYLLPRLSDIWEEFSRLGGGIGTRGPGEQKIEVDRRQIRNRISRLKKELEQVRAHRFRAREKRKRNQNFLISLIGYTNAGKSTLLNCLTGSKVLVEDKLFATLDPTTRRLIFSTGKHALLTDTVGFLKELPHTLIEAFKATLEEIKDSDLILEVMDTVDPFRDEKHRAVLQVLEEIEADHIPRITVYNKVDLLETPREKEALLEKYPDANWVAAATGEGIETLLKKLETYIQAEQAETK